MEGYYEILKDSSAVGKVQMIKSGLYYRFICRCKLNTDEVCRLTVTIGDETVSLGVLVPEGDGLALDKKIPAKHFGQGEPVFRVSLLHEKEQPTPKPKEKFVPLSPDEPFAYLEKLRDARFAEQDGVQGLWIPENEDPGPFQESSSSRPTGQWSEPKISE